MKRTILLLAVLTLVPIAAWGNGIDIGNQFGTITITSAGIVSKGSQIFSFNGITAAPGQALGTLSFSTGALMSGSTSAGGTFSSVGSSFIITGMGNAGQPKGVIFSGAFVGPISWTIVATQGNFGVTYQLSGKVQGQLFNGRMVTGTTIQTIQIFKNQVIVDHQGGVTVGNTVLVPEPGTLGLFGTGLFATAALFRRKLLG